MREALSPDEQPQSLKRRVPRTHVTLRFRVLIVGLFVAFVAYEVLVFNLLFPPQYGGSWRWTVVLPYAYDDGEGASWRYNNPLAFSRKNKYFNPFIGASFASFFHKEKNYYLCVGDHAYGVPFVEQLNLEWFSYHGYSYYLDLSSQEYDDLLSRIRDNQISILRKESFMGPGFEIYQHMPSYGREYLLTMLGTLDNPHYEGYVSRSSLCDSVEKIKIQKGVVEKFPVRFMTPPENEWVND